MLCVYTNGKLSMVFNRKCFPKIKEFSGLGPYTGASEQGEQGQRLLPQLLGRAAELPRKFVDVVMIIYRWKSPAFVCALYQINETYDVIGLVLVSLLCKTFKRQPSRRRRRLPQTKTCRLKLCGHG